MRDFPHDYGMVDKYGCEMEALVCPSILVVAARVDLILSCSFSSLVRDETNSVQSPTGIRALMRYACASSEISCVRVFRIFTVKFFGRF